MNKLTEQLDTMIQKAALDGARTQDAVKQFHELVEANDSQTKQLSSVRDDLGKKNKEYNDVSKWLAIANKEVDVFNSRVKNLEEREKSITTLELTAKHQAERVTDHKEMFKTVFRNSVLRKEVMTPVHPGPIDQYGTKQADTYPARDTLEEEET